MARYEIISRLDGALWLMIISKTPLTQKPTCKGLDPPPARDRGTLQPEDELCNQKTNFATRVKMSSKISVPSHRNPSLFGGSTLYVHTCWRWVVELSWLQSLHF